MSLKYDDGISALVAIQQNLRSLFNKSDYSEDIDFIEEYMTAPSLSSVFSLNDILKGHTNNRSIEEKAQPLAVTVAQECMDVLDNVADRNDLASELYLLLATPHFRSLFESYDDVLQQQFVSEVIIGDNNQNGFPIDSLTETQVSNGLPKSDIDVDMNGLKHTGAMKMVGIRKEPGEELGITVSRHDYYSEEFGPGCEIVVERIMAGSRIEQQGLLYPGDVIREVNGVPVDTPETLQKLMKQSNGTITLKVIPAPREKYATAQLFVRAHFSYNPVYDALIPCKEAGLPFHSGDIIQVLNQEDPHWWQARHWQDEGRAGLIPSSTLQERRQAFNQSAPDPHDIEYKVMGCGLGKKKKKVKVTFNAQIAEQYEKTDLVVYEEVARIPAFQRKVIVLLGAPGVGRRTIRNLIVRQNVERYRIPIPTTSRPIRRGEISGETYFFAGRDEMRIDIAQGNYIEHGELGGNLYGIKLDTVRAICNSGATCLMDCGPTALKSLRTAEFMPYVIFIAAPSTECMKAMYEFGISVGVTEKRKLDEDFRKTVNESINIERSYRHFFDWIIINDNMEACVDQLIEHLDNLLNEPQWVPVVWLY